MGDRFETRSWDGAGRVGELAVPGREAVTTPALLPVVNPGRLTVDPTRFPEFGAEALITNAYIIHGDDDLRGRAEREGLHEMLGFDGAIMCDSGAFQLAEYGEIDVSSAEILEFQRSIGADICTPVDLPTPPSADRDRAERELETTRDRLAAAAGTASEPDGDDREMLVSGPVQGATYPDLRERAGRELREIGFDLYPVGAVVPLLNAYRYDDVVRATLAAKRGLGPDAPVHLFGAGHPMVFALAAAAGCDLFDSAAYAIYARDGRYLTPRGTRQLADLEAFPCGCPICTEQTPEGLRRRADDETERLLAEHNLHASFAELRRVRQAIREGSLLELVETRARGHPRLLDGYRALLDGADQLETTDPAAKSAFFYTSPESARRPEVVRHHERIERFADRAPATLLLVEPPATADAPGVAFGGDGPLPPGRGRRGAAVARGGDGTAEGGSRGGPGGGVETDVGAGEGASEPAGRLTTGVDLAEAGDGPVGDAVDAARRALAGRAATDPTAIDDVWLLRPPFGPVPPALAGTYPLSAELPAAMDEAGQTAAAEGLGRLARSGTSLVVAHRDWAPAALAALPDGTTAVDLTAAPAAEGSS